ncbi:MAG: DUF4860 domain-containing protein [Anaerovoracaceae bacterium]
MKESRQHNIHNLFILVLIGVFAVCSVALIALGANVYEKTVAKNNTADETRITSLYFMEKLHQNGQVGGISISKLTTGEKALVLESNILKEPMETWIFLAQGKLREATVKAGTTVSKGFGQEVMKLQSLKFIPLKDNLLKVIVVGEGGESSTVNIYLPGETLEVSK